MSAVPQSSSNTSPALRFLATIMRPVVRLCMRLGVSANQANDMMRWLFVDEFYATRDLWHRKQPFASRAALLSGLSRKEVGRLRDTDSLEDAVVTDRQNRAARVLAGWRNDARFLDEEGKPARLPLKADDSVASFHTLVAAYSGDVPPRTVLDELRRANCVEVEADKVCLRDSTYGLDAPEDDFFAAASLVISALGNTADFNFGRVDKGDRRLMRVWYQHYIPTERTAEARTLIREATVAMGRQVDAELAKLAHREPLSGVSYKRTGLGAFYFED